MQCRSEGPAQLGPGKLVRGLSQGRAKSGKVSRLRHGRVLPANWLPIPNGPLAATTGLIDLFFHLLEE